MNPNMLTLVALLALALFITGCASSANQSTPTGATTLPAPGPRSSQEIVWLRLQAMPRCRSGIYLHLLQAFTKYNHKNYLESDNMFD